MILLMSNASKFSWIQFQSTKKHNQHHFMLRNSLQTAGISLPALHIVHRVWSLPGSVLQCLPTIACSPDHLLTGRMGKAVEISAREASPVLSSLCQLGVFPAPSQCLFITVHHLPSLWRNLLLPVVGCWVRLILACDFWAIDLEWKSSSKYRYSSLCHEI